MTRRVLAVVMDGVGHKEGNYGNAVQIAQTPQLNWLKNNALYRTLFAHGTHVGLPSDSDLGNSEVGHNALGAGRIFDQGAKLVQNAIDSGSLYEGATWKKAISNLPQKPTIQFFILSVYYLTVMFTLMKNIFTR